MGRDKEDGREWPNTTETIRQLREGREQTLLAGITGVPEETGLQPALEQIKISQAGGKRQEFQVEERT